MRPVTADAELVPAVRPTRVGIDDTVMATTGSPAGVGSS